MNNNKYTTTCFFEEPLDDQLDDVWMQVNDPFVMQSHGITLYHLTHDHCLDPVVAGISECLGLPQGLSFDDVFSRIN